MKKTGAVAALIIFLLMVVVYALALAAAISRGAEPTKAACLAMASPQHEALSLLALNHAAQMARDQRQSHDNFDRRYRAARKATGCREIAEICAESWPRQRNDPPKKLWAEFVRCWKQSPGHWAVASKKHKYVGWCAALGKNGVFYCCVIVGN